jgi:ADP-ribose pyrophosphatase YjhB (NUDIX family)
MSTLELKAPDYDPKKKVPHHKGARLIGIKEGKIALLFYDQYQYYVLPGGGIEPHETPQEAVIRETLEETGYAVTGLHEVVTLNEYFSDSTWQHHYFVGTLKGPPVPVKFTEEERKLGISLSFYEGYEALELLSTKEGTHPYSEAIMNREFLGLSEALSYAQTHLNLSLKS